MTAWSPVWQVSIDGGNYTTVTLSNLSMTSGRTDIYTQPVAGYATVELVNTNFADFSIEVHDSLTLQVKNSSGTFTTIFGGFVTDIDQSVKSSGEISIVQSFRITALGALSKLPKILTDGVLSKDFDGDQIYSVLEPVFINAWNEVAPSLTWATYTPVTETWANAQNVGLGEIDQPGDYELAARSSSETDVYSLVAGLATSGLGYIYEDAQGRICYADASHRSQYLAANGYTELSANHALSRGISTSRKIGDIRNKVSITHKNNGISTAQDDTSIALYGQQGQNILTSIEKTADALSQAEFYLALRANPQSLFKSITFELTNPELDDADRDALIGAFMGLPLYITDLPSNLAGGSFEGFVEGWSFTAGFNKLSITLNLSPVAFSLQFMKWQDVGAAETWNTLNPTLEWIDATIVA
jgi:hypothetical protein